MKKRLYWEGHGAGATLVDRVSGSKMGELRKREDRWAFCHLGRDVILGTTEAEVRQIAEEAMTGLLKASAPMIPMDGPLHLSRGA